MATNLTPLFSVYTKVIYKGQEATVMIADAQCCSCKQALDEPRYSLNVPSTQGNQVYHNVPERELRYPDAEPCLEGKMFLQFSHADTGNSRFYFKQKSPKAPRGVLYCTQPNHVGEMLMYQCSPDGEPSHVVQNYTILTRED
jgi:hypothetical protein